MNETKLKSLYQAQSEFYESGITRNVSFRKAQLKKLRKAIELHEGEIIEALSLDFGKPEWESWVSEIGVVYAEIDHALKHIKEWMKPKRVGSPLMLFPSRSKIYQQPMGRCLIIAPWNYPFQLVMSPLIPCIAAGNVALLKPSEFTPHTTKVIVNIIAKTFQAEYISVVEGEGVVVVPSIIDQYQPQHIFFTGSPRVGREIAKMAAEHLTPVVLELGGKSPAIVHSSASVKTTVKRILFGKFLNAGQTCIAPDYVIVHKSVESALIEEMKNQLNQWYGNNALTSDSLCGIIHERAFDRILGYLTDGELLHGGQSDRENLRIEPTLLRVNSMETSVMKEEIFGPVLPILTYEEESQVLEIVKLNPDPLSLYIFSRDARFEKRMLRDLSFGHGAVNNATAQFLNQNLPFGGIRNSGVGAYHGEHGFKAYSHAKGIVKTGLWFDASFKYPPYTRGALNLIKKLF